MTKRETAIRSIAVGNIFHATAPNGASLICLALEVTDTAIVSQTVTSVYDLTFDRETGLAKRDFHGEHVVCTIDSVAPLPNDFKETLIALHRAYSRKNKDDGPELKDPEHRALVFAAQFYPTNPIAPPSVDKQSLPARDPSEYESLTKDEKIDFILVNYLIPRNSS